MFQGYCKFGWHMNFACKFKFTFWISSGSTSWTLRICFASCWDITNHYNATSLIWWNSYDEIPNNNFFSLLVSSSRRLLHNLYIVYNVRLWHDPLFAAPGSETFLWHTLLFKIPWLFTDKKTTSLIKKKIENVIYNLRLLAWTYSHPSTRSLLNNNNNNNNTKAS